MRYVLAALLLLGAGASQGAVLNVPTPYATIQAAITAANPGDTVLVTGGTYTEQVMLKTGVTVQGVGKPVLDGEFIIYQDNNVKIDGFKVFRGGLWWGERAGIKIFEAQNIAISNNEIVGDLATSPVMWGILAGTYNTGGIQNVTIQNNTFSTCHGGIYVNSNSSYSLNMKIVNNTFTNNIYADMAIDSPKDVDITLNTFKSGGLGFYTPGTGVKVNYNTFGGASGVAVEISGAINAEKNWWGSASGPAPGQVVGSVDCDPWLLTPAIHLAAAGDRLVAMQNTDGGWGWPLTGPSALNTIAPIGMGLCKAYEATKDPDMLPAISKVATFLQGKVYNFSPPDGYLAVELDKILGGNTNVTHVKTHFYDKLALGTYNRNNAGVLYSTASYVNLVRTNRANQGIPNLAAWDVGMGLVAAKACGASTAEWIAGTEAEINELAAGDYDVIGLAGALYGLKAAGVEFDPSGGLFADASSLRDLADMLVGYQLSTGGFTRRTTAMGEGEDNETVQETAYAMLALDAMGHYSSEIAKAAEWLSGFQLATGGWADYVGANENNEVSAEAAWALWMTTKNKLYLDAPVESLYVRRGETDVLVTLNQTNLLDEVAGYQAFLSFDTSKLGIASGDITFTSAPFDTPVLKSVSGSSIDLAAGAVALPPTKEEAKLADLYFDVSGTALDGPTQIVFRANAPPTRYTDIDGYEVVTTTEDSPVIIIDGTLPSVTVTSPNGGEYLKGGGSWTITWTATDTNMAPNPIKIEYTPDNGTNWVTIATGEPNDGTYTWSPVPSLNTALAKVRVTATDLAENSGSDVSDNPFTIDSTKPTVTNIKLTVAADGSGTDLTPSGTAIQGTYYVSAYVSDNLAGIDWTVLPTITVTGNVVAGSVTADSGNGRFYVQIQVMETSTNGTANINVSGVTDESGNVADPAPDTFNVNKSQLALTVDLEGVKQTVTRTIKLVLGGSLTSGQQLTLYQPVDFTTPVSEGGLEVGRRGTVTITNLSNAGQWTRISAKDEQHTLRQTIDLGCTGDPANKQFVANFTGLTWPGGNGLFGGDATNDNWVDILDFGVFAGQYVDGKTHPLAPPARDADFTCDGVVDTNDFTFIQIGFLRTGDADPGYAVAAAGQPRSSVTVKELAKIVGMRAARKADVNNDGVVDTTDMKLFMDKHPRVKR